MTKELRKTAIFTDLHVGRRSNSLEHNLDCLGFVQWFCDQVRQDSSIDNIAFLGDWNQNRNAIHVETLHYGYECAKLLNELGLPVHFIVGNHDLGERSSRRLISTHSYEMFPNFVMVEEPLEVPNMGEGVLFSPYLFEHEYTDVLERHYKQKVWMGHFEFKDFVITGQNTVMQHGADHRSFRSVKAIFSGHYHKRQIKDNVVYTGNVFPADYSDTGDTDRGMSIYDHDAGTIEFKAWPDQPVYTRCTLSALMDMKGIDHLMVNKNRIQCLVDVKITYEEMMMLKEQFQTKVFKDVDVREFTLEESDSLRSANVSDKVGSTSAIIKPVPERIIDLLSTIEIEKINNATLISMFNRVAASK